jgi:hypothetical protein
LFTFETARSKTPDNLWEITFRLTNVIPERIIFVSRGITVYDQKEQPVTFHQRVYKSAQKKNRGRRVSKTTIKTKLLRVTTLLPHVSRQFGLEKTDEW